ncbi:MAG: NAD+ synthase [Pseudomonadota bacterium]
MDLLRIAQAQINVTVGDLCGNLDKMVDGIQRARAAGADIVTFPELSLCGYPPEDLLLKPGFINDARHYIDKLVPLCRGITVLAGFPDSDAGRVYNAAALICDGVMVDVYHKVELPNYAVFDEKRYFAPGTRPVLFDMAGVRFSITICEDIWIEGSVTEMFAVNGSVDVVLNIAASPFHAGKADIRESVFSRFARVTGTMLFCNNLVGGQDELVFDGGSMVLAPDGSLSAGARRFEEDLLLFDVDLSHYPPPKEGPRPCASPSTPHVLTRFAADGRDPIVPAAAEKMTRVEEIHRALVLGTADYVGKNGFKNTAVGLSGGIDSALTAAIAVEALGAENVIGVTMPSQYTSNETLSDAERLAEILHIDLLTVPIKGVYETYLNLLESTCGFTEPGVAGENLQARIRGNILMALSNKLGWLVLTTGNKSETAVGYCTLYGDTAGGFAVIKDVPKTIVYELSSYINSRAKREIIPESIILRPPTAELRPDQKDEDSLPPYPVLDRILRMYVEEDLAPDDIIAAGFDEATVDDVVRMVDRNEYKRRQAPPGVRITPKAFGKDRRFPLTNRYRPAHNRGDK